MYEKELKNHNIALLYLARFTKYQYLCHMIFYFSGTGNSKWAAKTLALETDETLVSIPEVMKRKTLPSSNIIVSVWLQLEILLVRRWTVS